MSLQLQQYSTARALLYEQLGADAAQELISKSIFLIASGSNDFGSGYLSSPERQKEINPTAYITLVVEAYKTALLVSFTSLTSISSLSIKRSKKNAYTISKCCGEYFSWESPNPHLTILR